MKMLILWMLLVIQPPTEIDLATARARAAQALEASRQNNEIAEAFEEVTPPAEEPIEVAPPVRQVAVDWQSGSAEDVFENREVLYLVTQENCPPCKTMKADLTQRGIPFTEIHYTQARAMGFEVRSTPKQIRATERVKVSSKATSAVATVESDTIPLVLPLLADHLAAQSNEPPPMKGLLDVDVDAPPYLPELINGLLVDQRWESSNLGLKAEWSGKRSITIESGRLVVSPPIKLTKTVGIIAVRCTLDAVRVSEAGQKIDLELGGSPDLTIMLRGYKAPATASTEFFYRELSSSYWKADGGRTDWTRESLLSHLRNGEQHRGKKWQEWPLEMLTFGQLRAIHDDDHEGKI